jgi:cation:H+ antiporter
VPTALVLLLSGAAVVTVGAAAAMHGIAGLAHDRGARPLSLGAAVFGLDLAALGVVVVASARGDTAIAAGASVGTVTFMVGIGFGLALLVSRTPAEAPPAPTTIMPLAALVIGAIAVEDLAISRLEGLVLIAAFVAYVVYLLQSPGERALPEAVGRDLLDGSSGRSLPVPGWFLVPAGLAIVYVGASLMVDGSRGILRHSTLAPGFVGAAIVGSLASAHRVLSEVVPMRRGNSSLAFGNAIGTVVAFTTGVLGLAALIRPLILDSSVAVAYIAASVMYTVLATAVLARRRGGRVLGAILIVLFASWIMIARNF